MGDYLGADYFPLTPNSYYVYSCESIVFDDFNQSVDTSFSKVRVRYLNEFKDSTNSPVLRVETDNPDIGFNEPNNRKVSAIKYINNSIVNYSDSFRTVKMVFPVSNGKKWNSNMYNNQDVENCVYKDVGKPYTVEGQTFDKTCTVVQNNIITKITEINSFEVYAKNIGMIYSENTYIQRFDGKVSGKKIITTLKEYN